MSDDNNHVHLSASPSSLPDYIFSSKMNSTPPRRGSASSVTVPSKHSINAKLIPSSLLQSPRLSLNGNVNFESSLLHPTHLLDSRNCDIKVTPLRNMQPDSDIDTDEDNDAVEPTCHNCQSHSKAQVQRFHPKFVSKSLPVTPRLHCCHSSSQNDLNGGTSASFLNGIGGASTPLAVAPRLVSRINPEMFLNRHSYFSPDMSHYATCPTSVLNEHSQVRCSSSSEYYNSLPSPVQDLVSKRVAKRQISRPMSEPCIQETHSSKLSKPRKCHSCSLYKRNSKRCKKESHHSLPYDNKFDILSEGGEKSDCEKAIEMQWKFIGTLIEELDKYRSKNSRLAIELNHSRNDIRVLKCKLEAYTEAGVKPGFVADIIGRIHSAQNMRDEAMMHRIQLANEERDAALAQTQSLLQTLGLSPRAPLDRLNGPIGRNNHMFMVRTKKGESSGINLSAIEEELMALRVALDIEDNNTSQSSETSSAHKEGKDCGSSEGRDEVFEELGKKLSAKETSRLQLQDRCSKLERVFSCLGHKVNGLNVKDQRSSPDGLVSSFGSGCDPTDEFASSGGCPEGKVNGGALGEEIAFLGSYEFAHIGNCGSLGHSDSVGPSSSHKASDTDGDDGTSSMDSMETSSAASWKPVSLASHRDTTPPLSRTLNAHYSDCCHNPSAVCRHSRALNAQSDCCHKPNAVSLSQEGEKVNQESPSLSPKNEEEQTMSKSRSNGRVAVLGPITEL